MNRLPTTPPAINRFGPQTGGACCGTTGGLGWAERGAISSWVDVYRLAYERAAAQLAGEEHRRRTLGHAQPGVN